MSSPFSNPSSPTQDERLRIEALRLAMGLGEGADGSIKSATAFYDFLAKTGEARAPVEWSGMLGRIQAIPEERDSLTRFEYAIEVEGRGWVYGFDDTVNPTPPGAESRGSGVYHTAKQARDGAATIKSHYERLGVDDEVHVRQRIVTELRTDWA